MASYGPYDGCFIEEGAAHGYDGHVDMRERARFLARERQFAIAEELNLKIVDEYLFDIRRHLEAMEVGRARRARTCPTRN